MKTENSPKISIIMPVYNVEQYLQRCLNSISAQTFSDWEAICVNDGSTDNCAEILNHQAQKDSRFKIVNQTNQSLSCARNNGFKLARGEYVYFLDSDDCMHPQCLEIAYNSAVKHNAELVSFGFLKNKTGTIVPQIYDLNKIKSKITDNPLFFQTKGGKFRISFNVWSKLYKRDLIKDLKFIPKIHFQDYPHTYAALLRRPRTVILDASLYFYTINPQSISAQKTSVQTIKDYASGLLFVCDAFQKSATSQELKFMKTHLVPLILEKQFKRCGALTQDRSAEIWQTFAQELHELQQRDFLHWRGHKLGNYFAYKKLLKEASKKTA